VIVAGEEMDRLVSHWPFVLVGAVGIVLIFVQMTTWLRRGRKSYQELLEPELQAHGFEFVSSTAPGPFRVGPFPVIEVEPGPYSNSYGITGSGHYRQYRIVKFRDRTGEILEACALIQFEFWKLKRIRWSPDLPAAGSSK
jgi:hypothetical protein